MDRFVLNPFTGNFDVVRDASKYEVLDCDNSAVEEGYFVRIIHGRITQRTDAGSVDTARCVGVSVGNPLWAMRGGVVERARFADHSPIPEVGKPVFLARADEEPLSGAAGKVTFQAPSSGVVAEVGIVVHVPPEYWDIRRAAVMLQVKSILRRAT